MRRTLMHRDVELLDFEADPVTGDARVVDETEAGRNLIASMKMDGNKAIDRLLKSRTISHFRKDLPLILESYHAHSRIELALMGHGLSLTDMFWYRLPNSSDRWADINLMDNEWDPGFGAAILSKDYAGLARCSLDVPDVTTPGHAAKAWERNDEGIFLVKAAERPDGADAQGVKLCSDLCAALFDEGDYVPVRIVKRYGRICSASPLMLSRSEELVNGYWLHVIPSAQGTPDVVIAPNDSGTPNVPSDCEGRNGTLYQKWDDRISAYTAVGIADASAHVAKMACCSCLALLADFHPGNFGVIRNADSGALRAAPLFDYDGSFGFPSDQREIAVLCKSPIYAMMSSSSSQHDRPPQASLCT